MELDQEADFIGKQALREIRDGDLLDRKLVGIDIGGEPMTDEGALNDFWPLVKGDAAARQGDRGRVVAPARAQHRLRVGADSVGGARMPSSRPRRRGGASR